MRKTKDVHADVHMYDKTGYCFITEVTVGWSRQKLLDCLFESLKLFVKDNFGVRKHTADDIEHLYIECDWDLLNFHNSKTNYRSFMEKLYCLPTQYAEYFSQLQSVWILYTDFDNGEEVEMRLDDFIDSPLYHLQQQRDNNVRH